MKFTKWLMPLGMISVVAYFAHVFIGQMLWKGYNPITTDISSLTAVGAPNAEFLNIFANIYAWCFLLFVIGMLIKAFATYHTITKIGYAILLLMAVTTVIGYKLFPLIGDKAEMNFHNMMHVIVTIVVVFTTISSFFLIGFGYLKREKLEALGRIFLIMAVLITAFGALNPIGMAQERDVLGLTERMVIFPLQLFVFFLSFVYSFNNRLVIRKIE